MTSRKLVYALAFGLIASILWRSQLSNPIKSVFRATQKSHNHNALMLKVVGTENAELLSTAKVKILSHPEVNVIEDTTNPGVFYLSRKASWQEQNILSVNAVAAAEGRNPKLISLSVGLDCEDDHHAEKVENISLDVQSKDLQKKFSLVEAKAKWVKEGGASLLVDALDRNSIDTGLARILTNAKKSERIENVLILFHSEPARDFASNRKKASFAGMGFGSHVPTKIQEVPGMPAALLSGTAEEILLYSNLSDVYFMAKLD